MSDFLLQNDNVNYSNQIYQLFEKYCQPGVYAMVNNEDKRIFISHSTNILNSASRVVREISNKSHKIKQLIEDSNKLEFVILEVETIKPARLVKLQKYISYYKKLGYKIYNKTNHTPKFKASYFITDNFSCWVCLVNSRYKKFPVKEFKNVDEAKKFIKVTKIDDLIKIYTDTRKSTGLS